MRDGKYIIDCDRHIKEPESLYNNYLTEAEKKDYLPKVSPMAPKGETFSERLKRLQEYACFPSPDQVLVNNKPLWEGMSEDVTIELNLQSQARIQDIDVAGDAQGQLSIMNKTGVDVAVLLPNHGAYYVNNDDIDEKQSRAYAYAYNRWMKDFMQAEPARLLGAAVISRHNPEAMVKDVETIVKQGFTAITLQSAPVKGIPLESPLYRPFWKACERNNITVFFHTFTHSRVPILGSNRHSTRFGKFSCAHPMEAMSGILSLLTGGVLETCPKLHFAFLEAGCSWLPAWLWRLDQLSYKSLHHEVSGAINQLPSEYFSRQIWLTLEPEEVLIPETINNLGHSNLIFGSDYPHMDHDSDNIDHVCALESDIGQQKLTHILWDNALRLLGGNVEQDLKALYNNAKKHSSNTTPAL